VDDDAPDGDARGTYASVRSTFGSGPGFSGGSGSGGPRGGGRRWVTKAPEEFHQVWAESTPPVVPLEG
jgi:hypothetical protein